MSSPRRKSAVITAVVDGFPTRDTTDSQPEAGSRRAQQAGRRRGAGGRATTARPMAFASRYAVFTSPPAQQLVDKIIKSTPKSAVRVSKPPTPLYVPGAEDTPRRQPGSGAKKKKRARDPTPGKTGGSARKKPTVERARTVGGSSKGSSSKATPSRKGSSTPKPSAKKKGKSTADARKTVRTTPGQDKGKGRATTTTTTTASASKTTRTIPTSSAPRQKARSSTGGSKRASVGGEGRRRSARIAANTEVTAIQNALKLTAAQSRADLPTNDVVPELDEFLSDVLLELESLHDATIEHNLIKVGSQRVAKRRRELREELLRVNQQERAVLQSLEKSRAEYEVKERERKAREGLHTFLTSLEVLRHSRPEKTLGGERLNDSVNLPALLTFTSQHSTMLKNVKSLNAWLEDAKLELETALA